MTDVNSLLEAMTNVFAGCLQRALEESSLSQTAQENLWNDVSRYYETAVDEVKTEVRRRISQL